VVSEAHLERYRRRRLYPDEVTFTSAGATDGIPLVEHMCRGIVYVSAEPSLPDDDYLVPGCGCRPLGGA
jgi:hypothetical protein